MTNPGAAALASVGSSSWTVVARAAPAISIVPYVRARGEALGVLFSNVGIVQRPERIVILGVSLLTSSIAEHFLANRTGDVSHRAIVIGLVLLAVSATVSSLQRLVHASRFLRSRVTRMLDAFPRGSAM